MGEIGLLLDPDESPWNPRWFPYGSFPLYLLKGVQTVYTAWPGAEMNDLRVAGRLISALADVGVVMVVYLLGSRMYGRREGVLASALVALAVIHIQLSHFYAVDTILGLCTIAALYFMYRVTKEGRLRDSLLAGVFIGLGVATKVSQAPIFLAFLMAHLLFLLNTAGDARGSDAAWGSRCLTALRCLVGGGAMSLLVFAVVQPYAFLDFSRFLGDVIEQSEMVSRIRDYPYTRQYIDTTPYLYQVRQLATWGLGWPLGLVAWAGLLYASLRGMRIRHGLAYLGVGWVLPATILLYSSGSIAMLAASGIAFLALVGTLPLRSPESRGGVLLLSWVAPYFLIIGAFQVKFLRYLIPITPLLVLFGSRMMIALWDHVKEHWSALRPLVAAVLLLLVGATAFYALSYMAVYAKPHTAVRTSQWINSNAPRGSVILTEHWEEGIPNLGGYEVRSLPMYEDDRPEKLRKLSRELAEADYVVFFSNRLYGTISRLPERYPLSSEYYRKLFSGELGYTLVAAPSAYPSLAGVNLAHDTFGRPGLPVPREMGSLGPEGLTLNLGFADESFSVYDHPLGLVFENVQRLDAETIGAMIEDAAPRDALSGATPDDRTVGLLLSPEDAEAQRQGGTWWEIIRADSWTARVPVLAWLIVVEFVGLLALPVTFALFRPLADRGYLFAKALGLLVVCLATWLLASLHWAPFTRETIAIAVACLGGISAVTLYRQRRQVLDFVRRRWPIILVGEVVFLLAFFSFVAVRMANPDLWHPYLGGEKPMDLAYLNAVLKSTYMPPYDPWFGGGYLNYYYWGQFIVATLIKSTGIDSAVAFNLAVPLFFALTVSGAFSIVYNLAERTRRSLGRSGARWSPVLGGVCGAVFVTVLGNLDGAVQVGQGVWRVVFRNMPFGVFDFWRSSRMMPPDPPGHEITEFPFFTFLFADLHAHLIAIPFTLLAVGLALAVVVGATRGGRRRGMSSAQHRWSIGELARVAALGVVVGALWPTNTWDFPTYMIVAAAAILLAAYLRNGGLSLMVLLEAGLKSALAFLVGYVAFLPFHLNYEAAFSSLESTTNQTVLWQFLAITGLFIFVIGSFLLSESRDWLLPWWRSSWRRAEALARVSDCGQAVPIAADERQRIGILRLLVMGVAAVVVGCVLAVVVSGWLGSAIPFLAIPAALALVVGLRSLLSAKRDAPQVAFVSLMVMVALALAIGLDIFRLEGDIDRMNSVFKFYLQVWVLLGLSAAYLLWRMAHARTNPLRALTTSKKLWLGALVILVLGASVYPVLGTQARLRNRFDMLPLTLDGMAYMRNSVYRDANGEIDLSADYEGIRWLQDNVHGSPIILEGLTPSYRWGGRISVYTGLPTVVGWRWHQEQQRWGYRWAIGRRVDDVNRIYNTTDAAEALSLLGKHNVEYVYVGELERLYYAAAGLRKFESGLGGRLELVYQNDDVSIYRVRQG